MLHSVGTITKMGAAPKTFGTLTWLLLAPPEFISEVNPLHHLKYHPLGTTLLSIAAARCTRLPYMQAYDLPTLLP